MLAMAACTAVVPFGWTNAVTYALSVLAIVITGVVLIQGYRDTAAIHAKLDEIVVRLVRPATMSVGLEHADPDEIKGVLKRLEREAEDLAGAAETRLLPRADRRVVGSEICRWQPKVWIMCLGEELPAYLRGYARAVRRWGPWPIPWMEKILTKIEEAVSMHARQTLFTRFIPACTATWHATISGRLM